MNNSVAPTGLQTPDSRLKDFIGRLCVAKTFANEATSADDLLNGEATDGRSAATLITRSSSRAKRRRVAGWRRHASASDANQSGTSDIDTAGTDRVQQMFNVSTAAAFVRGAGCRSAARNRAASSMRQRESCQPWGNVSVALKSLSC